MKTIELTTYYKQYHIELTDQAIVQHIKNIFNPTNVVNHEQARVDDLGPLASSRVGENSFATGSNALNRGNFSDRWMDDFNKHLLGNYSFHSSNVGMRILEERQEVINHTSEAMREIIRSFQDLPPNHVTSQALSATRSPIRDTATHSRNEANVKNHNCLP